MFCDGSEIFVNFCKRGIRKLSQSFNNYVGRFNNYVCVFLDFLGPTILSKKG